MRENPDNSINGETGQLNIQQANGSRGAEEHEASSTPVPRPERQQGGGVEGVPRRSSRSSNIHKDAKSPVMEIPARDLFTGPARLATRPLTLLRRLRCRDDVTARGSTDLEGKGKWMRTIRGREMQE
ncbi:hypothetical protein HPB51_002880 [Rhipicephalus microplus]|uniref:Uncharacterized protein n=1 Tax=Rhipicephalus microplus TaxID=6941 RepID=A0A9J6EXQ0_RHIMP|nr:hypothetical protein HPB51_002880 [Rhipicephalus microplus]